MADRIVQPPDIRARQKMADIPQQNEPRPRFPGLEQFHHAPFEEAQLLHLPVAWNVYADRLFEAARGSFAYGAASAALRRSAQRHCPQLSAH